MGFKLVLFDECFSPTAESFGVSAQVGSGVVRGGAEVRFHEGSTRVPLGFQLLDEFSIKAEKEMHFGGLWYLRTHVWPDPQLSSEEVDVSQWGNRNSFRPADGHAAGVGGLGMLHCGMCVHWCPESSPVFFLQAKGTSK